MTSQGCRLLALALAVAAAGCSGEHAVGSNEAAVQLGGSFGLLSLSWVQDAGPAEAVEPQELTATAQFVRYRAVDGARVGRLLGLPLDPDRDLPALDSCELDVGSDELTEDDVVDAADAYVDLLEAGTLQIELPSGTFALLPRHFPGLVPFVSGAAYDEVRSTFGVTVGAVEARGEGAEAVGSFHVHSALPAASSTLDVTSHAGGHEAETPALDVRWDAALEVAAGDVTYLELSLASSTAERVLRCAVRDDGAYEISAGDVEKLVPAGFHLSGGQLLLDLVRVRRAPFATRGLNAGQLRLTVRTRAAVPAAL